jgi:hypothetical protein
VSDPITSTTPSGLTFLGEYGNQEITITLKGLPAHSRVTVSFDLFILRSWDGNQVYWPAQFAQISPQSALGQIGPDIWRLTANAQTLLNTTFANWNELGFRQAYPGTYPGGDYPARTGAVYPNSLGYMFGEYQQDSVYRMSYTFSDSQSTLVLSFAGIGLQAISDESWGLDNLKVTVSGGADLYPYKLRLPLVCR